MNLCSKYHECIPKNTHLPTRVLDLVSGRGSEGISLLETNGEVGTYAALSHSWGQTHHIITTKLNIEDLKRNIRFDALPKTFQDAITICKKLEIQYIRIDSLCIIQDCKKDWQQQASLMGSIYACAYITIAASASTGDDTGCFVPRQATYSSADTDNPSIRDTRPEALVAATVNLSNCST
jgi:hypothetical protein